MAVALISHSERCGSVHYKAYSYSPCAEDYITISTAARMRNSWSYLLYPCRSYREGRSEDTESGEEDT